MRCRILTFICWAICGTVLIFSSYSTYLYKPNVQLDQKRVLGEQTRRDLQESLYLSRTTVRSLGYAWVRDFVANAELVHQFISERNLGYEISYTEHLVHQAS